MGVLGDFLSPEAGQRRRKWLDDKADGVADTLSHYLGPTGLPDRIGAIAQGLQYTDAGDMVEAADASRSLWNDPSLANAARYTAAGAAMALPFIGARGVNELSNNAIDWMADESGAIRAWHGSPHDFDQFSMDKIGTGEGAQAYGHGLYFAENVDVGRGYREALSRQISYGGTPVAAMHPSDSPRAAAISSIAKHVADGRNVAEAMAEEAASWRAGAQPYLEFARTNPEHAERAMESARSFTEIADAIEALDPAQFAKNPGRLYEVEINANPEDFLDWDAPLSAQPGPVREALAPFGFDEYAQKVQAMGLSEPKGGNIYESPRIVPGEAANKAEAARVLREAGIPGIRYLDAGSRGAGDGSRNYVVFDDRLITILNKLGIAGLGTSAALNMQPSEDEELRAYLHQ
jgi:hypothetical protein